MVVSKKISKVQKKSKYYRKKDFSLAKKAITEMEKRKWVKALSIAKKARENPNQYAKMVSNAMKKPNLQM